MPSIIRFEQVRTTHASIQITVANTRRTNKKAACTNACGFIWTERDQELEAKDRAQRKDINL